MSYFREDIPQPPLQTLDCLPNIHSHCLLLFGYQLLKELLKGSGANAEELRQLE